MKNKEIGIVSPKNLPKIIPSFLTSIGNREYPFLVMSGADSELSGRESRAAQNSKFLCL